MTAQHLSIEVRNIGVQFPSKTLLKDINTTFEPGVTHAILGPNGAGKSTLLRCIAGINPPSQGEVFYGETSLRTMTKKEVANTRHMLFQSTAETFEFSVLELVLMGRHAKLRPWQFAGESLRNEALEALAYFHVEHLCERSASTLSGGELQRVRLARAMFSNTPWWFLDEPVAHLDLKHQYETMRHIREHCTRQNHGAIVVVHDLNLAEQFFDHVLLLKQGRCVAHGPTRKVLTQAHLEEVFDLELDVLQTAQNQRFWTPQPTTSQD